MSTFPALVVEPSRPADAAVVWLHGLGASGHDFSEVVPILELPAQHGVRFYFPHAPERPITLNQGLRMPAWFDIQALTIESLTQGKSIEEGDTYLKSYLESIVQQGISSSRLILMGFSQGGALALYTGLRWNRPLAGIGGLSTYLPLLPTQLQKEKKQAATLPILLAHGWMDAVVPYALGQQALTQLQAQGYAPTWHPYPMDHSVCLTELEEIGKWIRQILEL